jgi:two-component system, cell cycle response regulator
MDILVINDDLMERSVIQQVLEHSQHKVRFVPTVREAWKLLTEQGFRFVIVDASREEGVVQQFIQHVRGDPNLPGHTYILLLIDKGQDGKLVSSLGQGVDDYLNKPVAPQELKSRVAVGVRILSIGDTLQEARDQLETLAMYDQLTGLMNRHAFYKIAQGELERARRGSEGLSVIALDIDNFQAINSEHGQAVGDNVLQIVAQIIKEKCRPYDCIGRWAGDQFTIALPGVIGSDAEKITVRILSGVQASGISLADGRALEVRLSAGIASTQIINAYAEVDTFIQSAVTALEGARQNPGEAFSLVFV